MQLIEVTHIVPLYHSSAVLYCAVRCTVLCLYFQTYCSNWSHLKLPSSCTHMCMRYPSWYPLHESCRKSDQQNHAAKPFRYVLWTLSQLAIKAWHCKISKSKILGVLKSTLKWLLEFLSKCRSLDYQFDKKYWSMEFSARIVLQRVPSSVRYCKINLLKRKEDRLT